MRRALALALVLASALAGAPPAAAGARSLDDRIENLSQELDSLAADIEDLRAPVAELDRFDQCMFTLGARQLGARDGTSGYRFGNGRRPALSFDLGGTHSPRFSFLAFPAEEPPGIECNEDAGEEAKDE